MERSLVQRSPTVCGVSECDIEASEMRRGPTRAVEPWGKKVACLKQLVRKQWFKRERISIIAKWTVVFEE